MSGRAAPGAGACRTYRLFGLVLASDFPFASRLAPADRPADVTFTCVAAPPVPAPATATAPVYASRFRTHRGESNCCFYRFPELDLLRFAGVGDFYLGADRIACHPAAPADLEMVEVHLLGTVLSCWLERAGVPALHAAAVVAGGRTVGFLSRNGGGKSSLAAALVRRGCPLLTDDVLPVAAGADGFSARHGYPQMRLWPETAERFCGPAAGFPRVHRGVAKVRVPVGPGAFGAFAAEDRPLTALYLPVRLPGGADEPVAVETLSRRDAVIELVRHSFVAPLVEAAGWQPERLEVFARLAAAVPVRRFTYPSGLDHLPRVADALLTDLAARGGAPESTGRRRDARIVAA